MSTSPPPASVAGVAPSPSPTPDMTESPPSIGALTLRTSAPATPPATPSLIPGVMGHVLSSHPASLLSTSRRPATALPKPLGAFPLPPAPFLSTNSLSFLHTATTHSGLGPNSPIAPRKASSSAIPTAVMYTLSSAHRNIRATSESCSPILAASSADVTTLSNNLPASPKCVPYEARQAACTTARATLLGKASLPPPHLTRVSPSLMNSAYGSDASHPAASALVTALIASAWCERWCAKMLRSSTTCDTSSASSLASILRQPPSLSM
mmetsp:Transcript_4811/g.11081  ORF Transcript_4811/g.11081 Transcript_4811/m.11081 type:complete len:267 (-) Transcript_4811:117-917(-)